MIRSPSLVIPPAVPFIRRATPVDVPAIMVIEREAFADPWDAGIFTEALSYYPTTYFVAVYDGNIAGFIVGALEDTGENIYGHICNFAVSGPYQTERDRPAARAPARAPVCAGVCKRIPLEVRESNAAAQRFYRRLGYENVFQVGGYYANGEDAIVMMKWFRF